MDQYLAYQIVCGNLNYWKVIERFPTHKEGIDRYMLTFHYAAPTKPGEKPIMVLN